MEMKKVTININDSTVQMLKEVLPGVAISRACAVVTEIASEWASESRDAVLEKFTEAELVRLILALKGTRIDSIVDMASKFFTSIEGFILMPDERKRGRMLAKISRLKDQEKLALVWFCNGYWKGQYDSIIDYVRDALKLAS